MSNETSKGRAWRPGRDAPHVGRHTEDCRAALNQRKTTGSNRRKHLNQTARRASRKLLERALADIQERRDMTRGEAIGAVARAYEELLEGPEINLSGRRRQLEKWLRKGVAHADCRERLWKAINRVIPATGPALVTEGD